MNSGLATKVVYPDIQAEASFIHVSEDFLEINFTPDLSFPKEYCVFLLLREKVENGFVGTYSISQGENGKVLNDGKAQYYLNPVEQDYYWFNAASGSMTITSFHQRNNMISGYFSYQSSTLKDPFKFEDITLTSIIVTGKFQNLKILER
jgi:hypothetical protein